MRMVSTPKPWVAARASPEIFNRMRLKTGSAMTGQVLTSHRMTSYIRKHKRKGHRSAHVAYFETGKTTHRDVLSELAHFGRDQLRDVYGLVLDKGLIEQADLLVELFHFAGYDFLDH